MVRGWSEGERRGWGGERVESSACGPRGNIFTLPSSFSSLFLPPLFLPCSFSPPPPPLSSTYLLSLPIPHSCSSSSQSELAARQMKIYRSQCPVGGFNLICHSVVAETTKGRDSRWTLLLVKPTASKHFYIPSRRLIRDF